MKGSYEVSWLEVLIDVKRLMGLGCERDWVRKVGGGD